MVKVSNHRPKDSSVHRKRKHKQATTTNTTNLNETSHKQSTSTSSPSSLTSSISTTTITSASTVLAKQRRVRRKVIGTGHAMPSPKPVSPTWFAYSPETSSSHKDNYRPMVDINCGYEQQLMRRACLEQFKTNVVFTLEHSLDTTAFMRYQLGVPVGGLKLEYFFQFFSQYKCVIERRVQKVIYEGQCRSIECFAAVFKGYETLPPFGCNASYAAKAFHAIQPMEYVIKGKKVTITKDCLHRMYFTDLIFTINPESTAITMDFAFVKELFWRETKEWIQI